jgi:hypothetical protein
VVYYRRWWQARSLQEVVEYVDATARARRLRRRQREEEEDGKGTVNTGTRRSLFIRAPMRMPVVIFRRNELAATVMRC